MERADKRRECLANLRSNFVNPPKHLLGCRVIRDVISAGRLRAHKRHTDWKRRRQEDIVRAVE